MKVKNIKIEIQNEKEFVTEVMRDVKQIAKGKDIKKSVVSFESLKAMRKFITDERLRILKTIKKHHPQSIYELARILGRDTKNVSDDVHYLADMGLIEIEKAKTNGREKTTPVVNYEKILLEIAV